MAAKKTIETKPVQMSDPQAMRTMYVHGFRDGAAAHINRSRHVEIQYGIAVQAAYDKGYARGRGERHMAISDAAEMF